MDKGEAKMKKFVYIFLWTVLGLILSFIAHGAIEMIYLNWAEKNDKPITWITVIGGGLCSLPLWLIYLLPILGVIFGIVLGFFCWKKLYGNS